MDNIYEYSDQVADLVADDEGIVEPNAVFAFIKTAAYRYSRQRPRSIVTDIPGTDVYDYDLPSGWVDKFSSIQEVEYPSGSREPEILDGERYTIYRTPTGLKLRFLEATPATSKTIRLTYTVPHTIDETTSTVPTPDEDAVCFLAGSLKATAIATHYAQQRDPTLAADRALYSDKSKEYQALAKGLLEMFLAHLGIKSETELPAAGGIADWDRDLSTGTDRLTHPRRRR